MKYNLFLFDLDDTLLDFKASETLSFVRTIEALGIKTSMDDLFKTYQVENAALWKLFDEAKTTKEFLRVERFRRTFAAHQIEVDPEIASAGYLEALCETVVHVDHAVETCQWLSEHGEIGIITNGIAAVQSRRIANSKIAPFISFVSVSEECGHAKPDVRFFEHTVAKARSFNKASAVIIGDREEADVLGGHNFGIDSCWYNPNRKQATIQRRATYEVAHLSELRVLLAPGQKA